MSDLQLTWWEYDQLVDTLLRYPQVWSHDQEHEWTRFTDRSKQDIALTLQVIPPSSEARFRSYTLHVEPMCWDQAEAYFESLCLKHTVYGDRREAEHLLISELNLPLNTARVAAIALAHTFIIGPVVDEPLAQEYEKPRIPLPSGKYIGTWRVEQHASPRPGILSLFSRGSELYRIFLSLNKDVSFVGTVKTYTDPQELHEALFNEPDIDERDGYAYRSEGSQVPPTPTE